MDIKFIYPQWGSAHIGLPVFLEKIKDAGYDGVELGLPLEVKERNQIVSTVKDFGLELVAQHYHTESADFVEHKTGLERHLRNMVEVRPLLINSHTGKDFFTFAQNAELIELAMDIESESGVLITHETHRSRFSFAAHVCLQFLEEFPDLKLTSDFSHWCSVAESMLENQAAAVEQAIIHTRHVHARVGSSQTAQVIDPRDERFYSELTQFKSWWRDMIESARVRGLEYLAIVPEYGPFPYQQFRPETDEPLADQWEVNAFIRKEIEGLVF